MKYYEPEAGEWVRPVKRGYKLACCDCGLVHRIRFWVKGKVLIFQAERDTRATKFLRKRERIVVRQAGKGEFLGTLTGR